MKITKIRVKSKTELRKPETHELRTLCSVVETTMLNHGFITEASIVNSTSIKVGNKRQFSIDIERHGYNTQHSMGKLKRTRLPSWDQRVAFNNALNNIFSKHGTSANISSGPFTVREGFTCFDKNDWLDQKPDYLIQNEANGYYIEQDDYKKWGVK